MRSKILMCLFAFLMFSVAGAFASSPAMTPASAPVVDQPAQVQDFLEALSDPSKPIEQIVVSCAVCSSNFQCNSICAPGGFCGGNCKTIPSCGGRKACDCLYCP